MDSVLLSQHIRSVQDRIAHAARAAGRAPEEITLCAATKVQTDDTIRAAVAAGIQVCGENRVQELTAHLEPSRYIGRCPQQVEEFLKEQVAPALAKYQDCLKDEDTELKV